uniref:Si:dkey-86e18.1 n=1 Tax=Neogobius melanostomus TaxID=47308 RepID=A0A8C6T6B2_9GOBI
MSHQQTHDHAYPLPQVFVMDGGGGQTHRGALPTMIPTWSFPPAQEVVRNSGKRRGCMGVSSRLAILVLLLFALVFASLGMGAVWTVNLQKELKEVRKMVKAVNKTTEELARKEQIIVPQKQIGLFEPVLKEEKEVEEERPAAHVVGRIDHDSSRKTLKWNSHVGRGFTAGGVVYRVEDGALQVNQTGLYYIYCRVELIFRTCDSTSSFDHSVFVRRPGRTSHLMDAHRQGFCPTQQGRAWTTDSYLGSVLHLQKDDKVLVNVSHPHYLTHEHYANFFGLYKV